MFKIFAHQTLQKGKMNRISKLSKKRHIKKEVKFDKTQKSMDTPPKFKKVIISMYYFFKICIRMKDALCKHYQLINLAFKT